MIKFKGQDGLTEKVGVSRVVSEEPPKLTL